VAARWVQRPQGLLTEAFADEQGQPEPWHLRAATVGDLLRRRAPAARVVAVAGKRRAALAAAGRQGLALWVEDVPPSLGVLRRAQPETPPEWLSRAAAAAAGGAGVEWARWLPLGAAPEPSAAPAAEAAGPGCMGREFPHSLGGCGAPGDGSAALARRFSPWLDAQTAAAALAALDGEQLGEDEVPDLLVLSFSALDYVGHAFGPSSPEALDTLRRVDRWVALLLERLDRKLGPQGWALVLTADHGAPEAPTALRRAGQDGGWVELEAVRAAVDAALSARHGAGPWVTAAAGNGLALRPAPGGDAAAAAALRAEACAAVAGWLGLAHCLPRPLGIPDPLAARDEVERLYAEAFVADRTWDLLLLPAPGYTVIEKGRREGVSHYDLGAATRHLPLLARLPGVAPARVAQRSSDRQVAPTLARLLGLDPLPGVSAGPLPGLPGQPAASPRQPLRLTVLHSNDHHGRDVDHPAPDGLGSVGGLGVRAGLIARLRAERGGAQERVLLLDAGDLSTGPCQAVALVGRASFEAMDLMGYDAMTLGNHEFDPSPDLLLQELRRVTFPALAANVIWTGPQPAPFVAQHELELGGYRVGVIGTSPTDTPSLSTRGNDPRLRFGDLSGLRPLVAALRKRVDLLVLLTHEGLEEDLEAARLFPEVDLILGGHSNTPTPEGRRVGRCFVAQAGFEGQLLGKLELELSEQGPKVLGYELMPVPATASASWDPDPAVQARVQQLWGSVEAQCSQHLGQAKEPFDRLPLADGASTVLRLVVDAMRWRAEADLALQNLGGVRADLAAGPLTEGDLRSVLPFGNRLLRAEVDGRRLLAVLDASLQHPVGAKATLHGSGLRYSVRAGRAVDVVVAGAPLDLERHYHLATNAFLARGGDGYALMAALGPWSDTGYTLVEALGDYLRAFGPASPDPAPRISWSPPPGDSPTPPVAAP